jgi:hypothetical protein
MLPCATPAGGSGRRLDDSTLGTMAQRTVIDRRRSAVLPNGIDPVLIAAAMNLG